MIIGNNLAEFSQSKKIVGKYKSLGFRKAARGHGLSTQQLAGKITNRINETGYMTSVNPRKSLKSAARQMNVMNIKKPYSFSKILRKAYNV